MLWVLIIIFTNYWLKQSGESFQVIVLFDIFVALGMIAYELQEIRKSISGRS